MEEERQGDQEPVKTSPFTDRSSDEETDVEEEAEESEHPQLDEYPKNSGDTAPNHVCEHCGKQFSSGKALGGHKRIHFQSSKRDPRRKKKISRKIQSPEGDGGDDTVHPCSICGKNFGSLKALYGHLRLHPDRPWRGAAGSNNQQQSSSPVRYDQSRPNPNPNPSRPIEPQLLDFNNNQVVNLPNYPRITLSVDMSSWTSAPPATASASRVEEQDTARILLLLACENRSNEENCKKRRFIDSDEKKRNTNGGDDEIRVCSEKKKNKVYICYPCNKSFNSHQAYGGHVSSHNKSGSKTDSTSRSDAGPSNESQPVGPPSRPRVLDFDLNELPPPEDDDEQGQFRSQ